MRKTKSKFMEGNPNELDRIISKFIKEVWDETQCESEEDAYAVVFAYGALSRNLGTKQLMARCIEEVEENGEFYD